MASVEEKKLITNMIFSAEAAEVSEGNTIYDRLTNTLVLVLPLLIETKSSQTSFTSRGSSLLYTLDIYGETFNGAGKETKVCNNMGSFKLYLMFNLGSNRPTQYYPLGKCTIGYNAIAKR